MGCSLCRQIAREVRASSPDSMPNSVQHLGPFNETGQRTCPECARGYFVTYQAIYDDMSFDEEVSLVRDTSDRAFPYLLEEPESYLREDAAYALVRAGHPERAWAHSDPLVRRTAVCALEEPVDLRFLLSDPDPTTRERAALLTLRHLVEARDSASLLTILQTASPEIRLSAVAHLRHSSGLDADLLAPALEELGAVGGFVWLATQGYEPERQIERLLRALQEPDEDVRKAAVTGLGEVRPHWTPAVLPALRLLLETDPRSRLWVLHVLRDTPPEVDLSEFYPELARILSTENAWHFQEAGPILSRRLALGGGDADLVHMLLPGLTFKGDYQRRLVGDCYKAMMQSGVDLGPSQEVLVQKLSGDRAGLPEDLLVPQLTTYLVGRQNWSELERLLRGGASIAGHVALCLSKERADYQPLKPVLNELLNHPNEWVAENCLKALVR